MEKPTATEVKAIIATSFSDALVTELIEDAVLIAEACPALVSSSAAKQKAVVRWISCHLISLSSSGQRSQEAIGDASESYTSNSANFGEGLKGTVYGQRALLLEPSLIRSTSKKTLFRSV